MLEKLDRDDFAKCVGDNFQVEFAEGVYSDVELTEVSNLKESPGQVSFSLVFLAPVDTPTESETFNMKNETLGKFEIFLTPFFKDDKGVRFEAVFSRLTD